MEKKILPKKNYNLITLLMMSTCIAKDRERKSGLQFDEICTECEHGKHPLFGHQFS